MNGSMDGTMPCTDPQDQSERIRQLTEQNRELKRQIRQMRQAEKLRRKVEFSKLIFVGVSVLTVSIVVFSCYMIRLTMDTGPLAYLIPAVFTEMASATGFYFWKAKAENKIKLMALTGTKPEASNFDMM